MNNNYLPFASGVSTGIPSRRLFTLLLLCHFSFAFLWAEGTQDVAPNPDDLVMLLIGDADFGSFASPAATEASRLYVRMNGPEETLYIGLSREFTDGGNPASTGSYTFRIKRASDGQVVHGPFSVNAFVENISSWEEAAGPAVLNGGVGYPTDDDRYVFQPEEGGLYYVEFVSADYIGHWDFTVAANGAKIPGRVYSKNWAFRTPTVENAQPECVWDRKFNGALYSYTTDGFVTRIDFADSGFQGLSFTMAFNTSGPGQSGDLAQDRMSIPGESPDDSFAEHLIFLSEPDPVLYPNGECGEVNVAPFFTCTGEGTYCLEVEVTQPGQVEVVIDANQNNVFDEGLDRRILYAFESGESLSACLDWDGLLGDGNPIPPGANVNLLVQYTQGVQHWTVYDGEFLKEGFCVEPIRPICPASTGSTDILYWDDRNIPEDPGTGQPKDGRAGCDCESVGCRTWNNFDPQTDDCSSINDDQTTGYGDKNALNTWWFASIITDAVANVPLVSLALEGESEVCEGETTTLSYVFTSGGSITNVIWTGPNGIITQGPDAPTSIEASEPGLYTVEIINESGCSFTATHELARVTCPTDLALDITASDLTPNMWQMVSFTITVTNEGPHFATDFTVTTAWPAGITNVQVVTAGGVVNGSTVDWESLSLEVGESTELVFTGLVTPALDHTVYAEITFSAQEDLDSTPGNGVDTNGNGQCADDAGDEDDGDCVELTLPPCSLTAQVTNISCFDNLTPTDPLDDTYGFTLRVTSAYGAGSWTGTLNGQPISGNYGLSTTYSGYAISGGDLTLYIEDATFGSDCSTTETIVAPPPCSTDCILAIETEAEVCNDEGTPYDPSDDTFSIRFRLNGINDGGSWIASDGSTGDYGVWYTYEGYPIADGDVMLIFSDASNTDCNNIIQTFTAPETCSDDCLLEAVVGTAICDPNGTLSDASDDTFTFTVAVTGWNTGTDQWQANDPNGSTGTYGEVIVLGPYPISGGDLSFNISDPTNPDCSVPVNVTAPNTCSDVCALTLQQSLIECQDAGTDSDPTDDTFTVRIRLTGANASNGWTASNGQNGEYGEWLVLGPFPIAEGDVTIGFSDNEIAGCSLTETFVAPETCSNNCAITTTTSDPVCDDNGTPWDPTDDTYTFFLTVAGNNTSSGWTANDPLGTAGIYGEATLMGPYLISNGNLSLTITDEEVASCSSPVEVAVPLTCSDQCLITATLVPNSVKCDDNDTPVDAADDFYTFTVIVDGFNTGGSWTASNGQSGVYGEPQALGPFPVADGDVSLVFMDNADADCVTELTVAATETCSNTCAIQEVDYQAVSCDDNGTPTDPTDDTYTFIVVVSGANVGANWTASDGTSGAYDTPVPFGPYAITDGDVSLTFTDVVDINCTAAVAVPAPLTCSDQCAIATVVENYQCFDNDTPYDASDDVFTFDLTVNAINNTGPGWIQPSGNSGTYGETYTQGPFLIADGSFVMQVQDVVDGSCTAVVEITPPASCSDECLVMAEVVETLCDDNGTPENAEDDQFSYSILVTGLNTGSNWVANDGTTGNYGEVVASTVNHSYADGILELIITDVDGGCADTLEVSAPIPALFCPDDVDQRDFTASIQILRGELNEEDELLTDEPCFLALGSTPILLGDRFLEPIDIDTLENGHAPIDSSVYNFFFFTNIELATDLAGLGTSDGTGMLFRGDYSSYDDPCCFNESYGASLGEDTSITNLPLLIDTTGMFSQDMFLVQHFTQSLRAGDAYTLVASTFSPGATGEYAWVIVSAADIPLVSPTADVSSEFMVDQPISEELTYFHIPWAQDEEESIDQLGYVILEPACGVDTLYFADALVRDDNCEDSYITRTFTMEYANTPIDSCDQIITFRRPSIDDIILPPATVTFQCGDDYALNENGYPDPQDTGYPLISSGDSYDTLFAQVPFFNLGVSYKDIPSFDTTDLALNLTREWNIVDACDGDTLYVIEQNIKVGPFGPPRLICPNSTGPCSCPEENMLIFGMDPFECSATVDIPLADLVGFCDESRAEDWSITTELIRSSDEELLATIPFDAGRSVANLERGAYTLRYIAEDLEGNRVERQCPMLIKDFQQPTAICRSSLEVTVSNTELTMLYPEEINLGSYDNCGSVDLLVSRYYHEDTEGCHGESAGAFGDWTSELNLDCCDVGQAFEVRLLVADADANENACSVIVTVVDDQEPVLSGLEPQNLMCSQLPQDFDPQDSLQRSTLFGMPQVADNCEAEITEMEPELSWDNCQLGTLTRKFVATDRAGNVSNGTYEQHVEVTYNNRYSIRFPQDITTDCVEGIGTVEFIGGGCGDFEVSYEDRDLAPEGAECLRLERTYTIINHCAYDGTSAPVALLRDEDCDASEGEEDLWLVVEDGLAYTDADSDASNAFPPTGNNGCGTNPEGYWRSLGNTGAWTYTQIIKIMDDTAPVVSFAAPLAFCSDGASCEGPVDLAFDILEQCLVERLDVQLFLDLDRDGTTDNDLTELGVLSNEGGRYDVHGYFPTGEHAFVIEAADACGNLRTERIDFAVVDCFIAESVCATLVEVQLEPVVPAADINGDGVMDEAAFTLSASELAYVTETDCSGSYTFSVNLAGEPINFEAGELILTCEDRYQAIREVVVRDNAFNPYAEQPDGTLGGPNYQRCNVTISVQDPNEWCSTCAEDDLEIEGAVRNFANDPLSGVQMDIYVDEVLSATAYTVTEGQYQFPDLELANTYRVRPYKNDDTAAGITTLDMIALARHLNGSAVITDPYVLLAADVDANGVVDINDFNYLGDLLLDRIVTWPNNTSWRFLPADYNLTDISTYVPDYIEYTDLSACQFGQDFIGIKVGDINGSLANSDMFIEPDERFLEQWWLRVPNYQLQAGDLYRIPVRARDMEALSGLDIALQLNTNGLRVMEIEEGLLRTADINSSLLDRGILKAIWVKQAEASVADVLFTLVVEAKANQPLAELLQIAEDGQARAYQDDLTPFQLQLEFVNHGQEAVLLENRPDPFRESTQIEFFLPQAGEYVLELTDARGKVLRRYRQQALAGRQQLIVFGDDLPSGMLFYTLTFNDRQLSRKMVKL